MEQIANLIIQNIIGVIILVIFIILIKWLFIKSAVKSGTYEALIEYHNNQKDNKIIPPEEDFQKELDGWK